MKWLYPALAVVLTAAFGLPFHEYDTGRLLPVQTVQVARTDGGVAVVSEVGRGEGADWASALANLRENASGEVFFDTAGQVILCDSSLTAEVVRSGALRPSAQVYYASALQEPEGLHDYLSAHESGRTVADLRAALAQSSR